MEAELAVAEIRSTFRNDVTFPESRELDDAQLTIISAPIRFGFDWTTAEGEHVFSDALDEVGTALGIEVKQFDIKAFWPYFYSWCNENGLPGYARAVYEARMVPLEQSPLDLHSLKALSQTIGATAGFGALVGAAAESHPLLLITVPTGIVICSAALAISNIIQEKIRRINLSNHGERDLDLG